MWVRRMGADMADYAFYHHHHHHDHDHHVHHPSETQPKQQPTNHSGN